MTGAQLDLSVLLDPAIAGVAIALAVIGVVTKAVGGLLGAWSIGRWGATTVGFGMVPRGEVGIVVANLALVTGVVGPDVFAIILVAVVLLPLGHGVRSFRCCVAMQVDNGVSYTIESRPFGAS